MNEFTTDVFMTKLLKNESFYFEFWLNFFKLQTIYLNQKDRKLTSFQMIKELPK